jgi:hypothetical protein
VVLVGLPKGDMPLNILDIDSHRYTGTITRYRTKSFSSHNRIITFFSPAHVVLVGLPMGDMSLNIVECLPLPRQYHSISHPVIQFGQQKFHLLFPGAGGAGGAAQG